MSQYRKLFMALAGFLGVTFSAFADGVVSETEITGILSAGGAVYLVYKVANKKPSEE